MAWGQFMAGSQVFGGNRSREGGQRDIDHGGESKKAPRRQKIHILPPTMSRRLVPRHQRYQRIAPVIDDIAITIIVVLAMRHCIGLVEEVLRRERSLAGRAGAHTRSPPYSVERATLTRRHVAA